MNTRELGRTGIQISELAFGGVEIGVPYGIGINSKADMLSRPKAIELLHAASDQGINFFDTARLYGESESIIGEAFQKRREKVIISTKCSHIKDSNGRIPDLRSLKNKIELSVNDSLRQLRTDYIDVFMLHYADMEILNNDQVKEIFDELKTLGKVRAIGASTYTNDETRLAIDKGWEVLQVPFNLLDQRQEDNFAYARENGVALTIRSVLMKGLLTDKGRHLHPALRLVEKHIGKYQTLLSKDINEVATLALKFALSFGEVSSVLLGIDRMEYLEKAIISASGPLFGESDKRIAKTLSYPDPEFLDLQVWDRKGWLK